MSRHVLFALSLLLCSSAFGADEPTWLREARAREAKSLALSKIESQDGWFKASTPGKSVVAIENVEGSYSVELDIGADLKVHCEVYPKGVDLANSVRNLFNSAMASVEQLQGKLEAHALESADAGAYGGVPYIAASWVYRIAGDKGAMLGGFKQFVIEKNGHVVYCAHNEFGFARTFEAIAKAFAETLQTQAPPLAPQYTDISVATLAGKKLGVVFTTIARDSEGDTKAKQTLALLFTIGNKVVAQDATQVEWVRPDGTLINAASTQVTNGDVATDLALTKEDSGWTVEGEFEGKALKASLPENSEPGNSLLQARQLRSILAEPDAVGREHTINIWDDEDPGKLRLEKTRILSRQGDDRYLALAEVGGIKANLTLDKSSGLPSAADLQIGPIAVKIERVYVNGSF